MKRTLVTLALGLLWALPCAAQLPDLWNIQVQDATGKQLTSAQFPRGATTCGLAATGISSATIVGTAPTAMLRFLDPSNPTEECALLIGNLLPGPIGTYTVNMQSVYNSAPLTFTVVPPSLPSTPFSQDSFTGTVGTSITAHKGELGATWVSSTANNGATPGSVVLSDVNTARSNSVNRESLYTSSGQPPGPEYTVKAKFIVKSVMVGQFVGVMARVSTSALTYYALVTDGHTWTLSQALNGAFTTLGTCAGALVPGVTYNVELQVWDATKTVTIDKVVCTTSPINSIPAAGLAGFAFYQPTLQSNTTGIQVDDFVAVPR